MTADFTIDPAALGLPEQFHEVRPAQLEAVEHVLTSAKRFCPLGLPTGVGKSLLAVLLHKLLGSSRTVVLTGTKSLQSQYADMFAACGMADIRGRNNFPCWEGGSCEDGRRMGCKDFGGCPYSGALAAWQQSELCVTSYAFWLSAPNLVMPELLICDEAGQASEWLSRSLDFTIREDWLKQAKFRGHSDELSDWRLIAPRLADAATDWLTQCKSAARTARPGYQKDRALRLVREAEQLFDASQMLMRVSPDNWVVERRDGTDHGREWRFECVWPGQYRERLFQQIPRVVLMSGTLRPKTLQLLGIAAKDADFREWGRQFSAANGPVLWVPTARVTSSEKRPMSNEAMRFWLERHAQILDWAFDRRGIIQTVSYKRADDIARYLAHNSRGHRLLMNKNAEWGNMETLDVFKRHINGTDNSVICSPSFSTGWDFAGRAAEFQIISKLPIPDTRSKVMQARLERDRGYSDYLCAQELVQSCGRIVRGPDDRGVSVCVDDNIGWFLGKAKDFLPRWFTVRKEAELPTPLKKL